MFSLYYHKKANVFVLGGEIAYYCSRLPFWKSYLLTYVSLWLWLSEQMEIYNLINNITKSFIVTDTCSVVTEILLLHVSALLSFGLTTTGKKCEFCVPISLFVPTTEGQVYLYNKVK